MSEARAEILTSSFTLICPHCKERQVNGGRSHQFRPGDVRPNEKRTCTNKGCGKTFQLPAQLKATVRADA